MLFLHIYTMSFTTKQNIYIVYFDLMLAHTKMLLHNCMVKFYFVSLYFILLFYLCCVKFLFFLLVFIVVILANFITKLYYVQSCNNVCFSLFFSLCSNVRYNTSVYFMNILRFCINTLRRRHEWIIQWI